MRLILVRHAKSSWEEPGLDDHARPLNDRGRRAAAALGRWLVARGHRPDEAICSTATRTRETWAEIARAADLALAPRLVGRLYHAPPEIMRAVLREAGGQTVVMVGHNPGIAAFAAELPARRPAHADFARYPTGATLVVDFPIDRWDELRPGTGDAREFLTPRMLEGG
ncbi:MAG: histidine phosphatase family protein [Rhodobacteraceae bacterium]|jgi:phosphohistidine phosphatase|nr:histidine phosphatase family protein [Paracoccaceae bacterium]